MTAGFIIFRVRHQQEEYLAVAVMVAQVRLTEWIMSRLQPQATPLILVNLATSLTMLELVVVLTLVQLVQTQPVV